MTALPDFEGIRRLLPQGHPFIFVDRVLDFESNRYIVTLKNVTGSEPFFAGHFKQLAVMPGALIGEAIAQSSILLFRLSRSAEDNGRPPVDSRGHLSIAPEDENDRRIFVVGTTRTRFLQPVFPGDSLTMRVEVEKLLSSSAMVSGWGEVDGRKVVKTTLTLSAIDAGLLEPQQEIGKDAQRFE